MVRPGNRLLVWFLACSFAFFVVAVIVDEFALFDSDAEVLRDNESGGATEQESALDDPVAAAASGVVRGDHSRLSGRQLRLVSTTWPPFIDVPGKPRFALDLVEATLERVGVISETVIVEADGLTSALLGEMFDGSAAVWKSAERERALIYSQPYLENRLILVGRRGSDVSATSLAGLAGASIAMVAGYAYGEAVETTNGPIIVDSSSEEDSVAKLLNGVVDYTLMDDLVVQYIIRNHGEAARTRLAFGTTTLVNRTCHLAVRRSIPDADLIISQFNAELRGMIANRSYHRLLHLDWIRADVDGDGLREYVPRDDQIGPRPPDQIYDLYESDGMAAKPDTDRRYYFGGNIYEGWSSVPRQYKTRDSARSNPGRSTIRLFTFRF